MASRAKAKHAKSQLGARLAGRRWLRGIGLEGSGDQYHLRVNVDALTPDVRGEIPDRVEGVEVSVQAVGNISAQLPSEDRDS